MKSAYKVKDGSVITAPNKVSKGEGAKVLREAWNKAKTGEGES